MWMTKSRNEVSTFLICQIILDTFPLIYSFRCHHVIKSSPSILFIAVQYIELQKQKKTPESVDTLLSYVSFFVERFYSS